MRGPKTIFACTVPCEPGRLVAEPATFIALTEDEGALPRFFLVCKTLGTSCGRKAGGATGVAGRWTVLDCAVRADFVCNTRGTGCGR